MTETTRILTRVDEVRVGDVIHIGTTIEFTVRWVGPGWGRTWILRGHIPADHPIDGEGSELSIELERGHTVVVDRPAGTPR